jgi:endonuclease-8
MAGDRHARATMPAAATMAYRDPMPEGHTIHRLARDLAADLGGAPVRATSPQGRFADGAALIDGAKLEQADAHGKHLFCVWSSGDILHVHLGLIGKFRRVSPEGEPRDTIRLRLEGADTTWQLSGPQTCAIVTPEHRDEVAESLGPDPLRRGSNRRADFIARLGATRRPIGAVLLDQGVVAGIGNVYRAELLWICGIHPEMPAASIDPALAGELWDHTVAQLKRGVDWNRIVTVSSEHAERRITRRTRRDDALYVYKREEMPCRRCDDRIASMRLGGRTIAYCPTCQPA